MRDAHARASAWASGLLAASELDSAGTCRSQRSRQRFRASSERVVASPILAPGRKAIVGKVGKQTAKKRRQRDRKTAKGALLKCLMHFTRLRVILKTSIESCSDFRRMARLAGKLFGAKASPASVAALLLYDRCWRDARLSQSLVSAFVQAKGNRGCKRAFVAIAAVKKHPLAKRVNHRYWQGPAAFVAHNQAKCFKPEDVKSVAEALGKASRTGTLHMDSVVHRMTSCMQHVNMYSTISYLRVCEPLLGFMSVGTQALVHQMSPHVDWCFQLCSHSDLKHLLHQAGVKGALKMSVGDVALNYCELFKIFRRLGIVPEQCVDVAGLTAALVLTESKLLLRILPQLEPLTDADANDITSIRFQESADVDRYLPPDKMDKNEAPHYCKGAENMLPRLIGQMRLHGWLAPLLPTPMSADC